MSALFSEKIVPISIETEMKNSYLDYAMSVIVSRALPDVRDGLKPVHRRIIFAMNDTGCHYNRPYRKSARIVGDVMGKYHPHGDSAIYDSLVRMAQDFSMRAPLIDGQGNFGSMDGDSPAAMRYTESRMAKIAHELIEDINKDTVNFKDNYDGSEQEPEVLPAKFPNILVNGSGGIAVGMATNIPPYNLGEVIDGLNAIIDNKDLTDEELIGLIPAPDFPTGGIIVGRRILYDTLAKGRGSIIIRGKAEIEENKHGRESIIITEIPYQVNKALMIEKVADLVKEGKIEGISEIRDESDKQGIRVAVELKKGAQANVILNQLYKFTPLQTSFGVNILALDNGMPKQMGLRQVLSAFFEFRKQVVQRRTNFLLRKAREKAHILIGLYVAVSNIDEVIALIKASKDTAEAKQKLLSKSWSGADVVSLIELVADFNNKIMGGNFKFTEGQATAILDMRLAKLTGLEIEKIKQELQELAGEISKYLEILADDEKIKAIIKQELAEIKENFANPRRTAIEDNEAEDNIESLIPKEDMVVTITYRGYVKRVPLATYRAQKRGGKGKSGLSMKDEDFTTQVIVSNTHTNLLFFSSLGKVYRLKTYKLPLGNPQGQGRALINLLPLQNNERVNIVIPISDEDLGAENSLNHLIFATKKGNVRKSDVADFLNVPSNGKIAMKLDEDDALISVLSANDNKDVFLVSRKGKCIRFNVEDLRVIKSRSSSGVIGMVLEAKDEVIDMAILDKGEKEASTRDKYLSIPYEERRKIALEDNLFTPSIDIDLSKESIKKLAVNEEFILSVTENGFGKRSSDYEYRLTARGGKGVTNILTSERNGSVIASFPVKDEDEIIMVTNAGQMIRTPIITVRVAGRNTQGVNLFTLEKGEKVVSVAKVEGFEEVAPS